MKFLIQLDNDPICKFPMTEDGFQLRKSVDYLRWLDPHSKIEIEYELNGQNPLEYCPVGTVEFVHHHMALAGLVTPSPLNVPLSLLESTKRRITAPMTSHEFVSLDWDMSHAHFAKDASIVKGKDPVVFIGDASAQQLTGLWQFSEFIHIESEWRIFVHNNMVIGLKHYAGDPYMVPEESWCQSIAKKLLETPTATIDVACDLNCQWDIIEAHHFYSCGLYGFDVKLANMLWRWWVMFRDGKIK